MMGKKKLSAVRADVRSAFARAGIDPATWFEQEIQEQGRQPSASPSVLITLQTLRDALAKEVRKRQKKTKRRTPVR